jgi:hypothetical protein
MMGDRANFGIRTSDRNTIFIYLHWGGTDRHEIMANAIAHAMAREGDEGYFTRIFVSRIIAEDWNSETGAGMSINRLSASGDWEDIPIYDYTTQTIGIYEEAWDSVGGYVKDTGVEYTRDQYLAQYGMRVVDNNV